MNDEEIRGHIDQLVYEERQTRAGLASGELPKEEAYERLHALTVQIDQYWDLLRQRQGFRDAGRNPDEASLRPAEIVEQYEQ